MNRTKGFTLVEVLIVITIIGLLVGLLLPGLGKAQRNARSVKDGAQVREIHQAFLTFANGQDGRLPTPGLINRKADPFLGHVPGSGPENYSENNSQSLYSCMVAQDYFNTDILIGPTEVNPVVVEDTDYDHSEYAPGDDRYWDRSFRMYIFGYPPTFECNGSYAHMAIVGYRRTLKWRDTQAPGDPIIGTRGIKNGDREGSLNYDRSPTLLLHGPSRQWVGNICFADNHTERLGNFYPQLTTYEPAGSDIGPQKDNIFAAEFADNPYSPEAAADAWLVITKAANPSGFTCKEDYDRLLRR